MWRRELVHLVVGFEPCSDFSGSCTMRVRQTRVAGECSLDNPEGCNDAGCVAVRWDLRTGEGVLLDLFKAKAGERIGCDISSADDGTTWNIEINEGFTFSNGDKVTA